MEVRFRNMAKLKLSRRSDRGGVDQRVLFDKHGNSVEDFRPVSGFAWEYLPGDLDASFFPAKEEVEVPMGRLVEQMACGGSTAKRNNVRDQGYFHARILCRGRAGQDFVFQSRIVWSRAGPVEIILIGAPRWSESSFR